MINNFRELVSYIDQQTEFMSEFRQDTSFSEEQRITWDGWCRGFIYLKGLINKDLLKEQSKPIYKKGTIVRYYDAIRAFPGIVQIVDYSPGTDTYLLLNRLTGVSFSVESSDIYESANGWLTLDSKEEKLYLVGDRNLIPGYIVINVSDNCLVLEKLKLGNK